MDSDSERGTPGAPKLEVIKDTASEAGIEATEIFLMRCRAGDFGGSILVGDLRGTSTVDGRSASLMMINGSYARDRLRYFMMLEELLWHAKGELFGSFDRRPL